MRKLLWYHGKKFDRFVPMKRRNTLNNTKRALAPYTADTMAVGETLAGLVGYGGNSEHKRNPGDFGLTPPSGPRPGKSLCDTVAIFSRKVAIDLLKEGARRCLISDRTVGGFPKNIWAVTDSGIAVEAQLENPLTGTYHGYPMPESDPFVEVVIQRWNQTT